MLYQIVDGSVSLGGKPILTHIYLEIKGRERIALVGRNGSGKTTLLKVIAGEISLDRDDKRSGPGIVTDRSLTVGMLSQQPFDHPKHTVNEELAGAGPAADAFDRDWFEYETEYNRLFTGFGFSLADKNKPIEAFSGGEQTKIGLIRLLLQKPDLLLLDEPTNHLDLASVAWLEEYLCRYPKAVVMVSHDRFFLDRTAQAVYEIEQGSITCYKGNYSEYRRQKVKAIRLWEKAWERQQQELKRIDDLVERFKHKPRKASFARAKRKMGQRMEKIPRPPRDNVHLFTGAIVPESPGSKWVYEADKLKIGYDVSLAEISLRIKRGQKIGIIGDNGVGKSTFLKTAAGLIGPLAGKSMMGNGVEPAYFDQHAAAIASELTVREHFHRCFPAMSEKEVRAILGAYLFPGADAHKKVSALSGGEKARLVLAEILTGRPNFLLLDEPTNHMDIQARETLESAFQAYSGTILFISHDRYFIKQVAQSVLVFDQGEVYYYPFGYEHYLERASRSSGTGGLVYGQIKAEDQALVDGQRAVPKPERRRLKEIPPEEAYGEWQARLAKEKMAAAKKVVFDLEEELRQLKEKQAEQNRYLLLDSQVEAAQEKFQAAAVRWGEACVEWYEWEENL